MSRQFRSDDTDKWKYGFGNGSDGDLTISSNTTEAPIDSSCSGTSGATSLSATNASFTAGQLILIHQSRGTGAGNWELNKIQSYVAGTITLAHALQNTYTDSGASQAQVRVLKQYNNVTINSSITWTGKSWNKDVGGILFFLAKTSITVTGTIALNGATGATTAATTTAETAGGGFYGGYGRRNTTTSGQAGSGEGTSGDVAAQYTANGNGAGGAAGDDRTGGGGGNGAAGTTGITGDSGGSHPGYGGNEAGNAGLTSMVFGGGGGGGAEYNNTSAAGAGGSGGGIIGFFAPTVVVTGGVTVNGGNGGNGNDNAAGGGGAGGSILIKAQTATLGTNLVTANYGVRGASGSRYGGHGAVGRIHLDYKDSYTGTTTPTLDARQDATLKASASSGFFPFL